MATASLTALILTWNEQENIGRTLSCLYWLDVIVIIDSGSTDKTLEIISTYPKVKVHYRKFDTHARQWNYGLSLCESGWILSLDADYILHTNFIDETKQNLIKTNISAFNARFEFCIFGKPLRTNNTTARPVLFKKSDCIYYDDGHTQRLRINGVTGNYKSKIWHDDRKPLGRWLINQSAYSLKEAIMLVETSPVQLSFIFRLRKKTFLAPVFIFFYCLFIKGLIFNGWRGIYYTYQRTIAEILIYLRVAEEQNIRQLPH